MTATLPTQTVDLYQRSNLTRLQLLFWAGQRLRPDTPLFNTVHLFTIAMEVDPARFRAAFQALVEHSDALRTVFEEKDGVPQQRVVADFSHPLESLDFSSASNPETTLQAWLQQRCGALLDLEKCPYDSALIKVAPGRFVWYVNLHHIIVDAGSLFLLFERLARFYERPRNSEPGAQTGLPAFAEYIDYERAYRSSPQYARSAAYWEQKLLRRPEPIRFFNQRPVRKTARMQRVSRDLGVERSRKIRDVARLREMFTVSEEFSLFNVFAALFCAQLHTMSGSSHLGLLMLVHNRFAPVFKNITGLLMEYCPLQVEISADDSFSSLLAKVKRETRESFAHYQYGSGLPLQDQAFDVIFNMYQVPALRLDGAPVQVERIHPGYGSERLALHVNDVESDGMFVLHFDFSCDVFNEAQREEVVRHFVQLIDAFLEDHTQSFIRADLLETEETNASIARQDPSDSSHGQKTPERQVVPPRDERERQLVEIWERVLGIEPIGVRDNFFDLGGSSWLAVRLFAEIGRVMGITLPLHTLLDAATIEELAETLRRQAEPARWTPLVAIQRSGTRQPFFCVHGAGGHILLFDKLARLLGPDQPFFAFQAQGTEEGQRPFTCIEDMAACYVAALREFQPEGPYLLGGYSMGGMVAFEMARQLQAQNQAVDLLAIIDVPAQSPQLRHLRRLSDQLGALLGMSAERQLQLFLRLRHYGFRLGYFARLKFSDRIAYVRGKLGSLLRRVVNKGFRHEQVASASPPEEYEETDVQALAKHRIRKLYAINEQAFRAYIPDRYQGRAVIIRSTRGYTGDPDKDYSPDPHIGWGRVISGMIETYEVPGDHNEMIREPHVRLLAQHLRTCLDNAQHRSNSLGAH